MRPADFTDIARLPGKATWGGHVYLIEFDNGTVKAGSTTNPHTRIRAHEASAACFGIGVTRVWVSREFHNFTVGERALLSALRPIASRVIGQEWFVGVSFDDAARIAPELTYSNRGAQARRRRAAEQRGERRRGPDPGRWYSVDEIERLTGWSGVRLDCPPGQDGMTGAELAAVIDRYTVPVGAAA